MPSDQARCPTHRYQRVRSGNAYNQQRLRILARDGYQCQRCGAPLTKSSPIDHVIPLRDHGTEHDMNKQALCQPCNQRKG